MKEIGLNQVNSLEHTGNKAFDPLRILDRRLGVAKKSRDSVNVSSPKDRQAIVARAALRVDNIPNGDTKFGSLVSRKRFGEQSSFEGQIQTGSRLARDVRARASLGEPGSPEAQEWLFKSIFEEELLDRGIYVSGNQERELLPINFNSSVSDVPAEWRKVFFIARGKACERVRMEGHNLHSSEFPTENRIVLLSYNNNLYEIHKDKLPDKLSLIFKKESKEGVIISSIKDVNSLFACKVASQELGGSEQNENFHKLEIHRIGQKELELQKMRNSQREQELDYALFLQNLHKAQLEQIFVELQKNLPLQENINRIKKLIDSQNRIKDIVIEGIKMTMEKNKLLFNQKKKELEQSENMQDAYYMIMGTPEVRSIVEKLPEDYTIDSMTLEEKRADGLSLPIYRVGLSIKRVNTTDKQA